ncbi:N-acetylmuramoyl-L-alanine amidase [Legionella birminghamensis]|uniref:N-acetylmuramoyl-L-alanine amidase AmiC n=1 Tax=Legionella birminghamensis TaxID=28083 RepID=A0A378I807_9GAMM|nr:N-acetylmuramoyl-L-alanine amidase [Legionella birminghamensis]KTC73742.1 N-acetylmuramoyl-L-alanine amidase [Legionella birminghamensis]STX30761.1 N-acetylmuramoyl-L-alanine amidase [Legionella birminghamensis]
MKIRVILLGLLTLVSASIFAAKLQSIEIKEQNGKMSLFFSLDTAIAHKVFTLTNPDRVVVDFESTDLVFNLNQLKGNKLIKRVRSGRPNPQTLRLVFEVTDVVMLRTSPWASSKAKHAFTLDLSTGNGPVAVVKPSKSNASTPPAPVRQLPGRSLRDVVIVLDPGHGGKDPGAKGPHHNWEKNVTLAIASKLKHIIDRQPGMRAVLTRNGDYYVGLRERLNIARKYNGDVFISIHADAFINQQSNGASVFALSQRGATSEAARWLAEKENYSELGGVNLADLDDQSGLVRTVLIDLSQTATVGASLHMGERVLRNLDTITRLHNRRVEQARFMVLKSPDIPSILIETGFISNPQEESNLTNAAYQARLTQAIFQGIKGYFWDYPPHGTRIEVLANSSGPFHLVKAGDSLPKIAARYKVTVAALQAANHLNDSSIKTGQRLTIPAAVS